ncbi:hypothetical protein [Metabacillus sediminilitoris]|uniref:Uncharacterized protein n=1 Tax=Metabacillus sediminilitoris TaxID=2567941 RepID=A0A4S4BPJ9_9BACI|nr:hypothetical protein [Metabacillus sediminilitoris]QGQ46562.1 hypothetical protein GMB29_15860 [Metabacillus sediminilitoris]THF75958.1 hypothetical protein E6W99_22365 [Metabacillus sediminilitoris]
MSQHYYDICCRYQGKDVRINDRNGRVHVGRILKVTRNKVYIEPRLQRGGYGIGFYGGYGYGYGYPYGIGLGFITGIVLGGLLFW